MHSNFVFSTLYLRAKVVNKKIYILIVIMNNCKSVIMANVTIMASVIYVK